MRVFRSIKKRTVGFVLLGLALVVSIAVGSSVAASASPQLALVKTVVTGGPAATQASGCVVGPDRVYEHIYVNQQASCGNSTPLNLNSATGSGGGAKGDKGDTGAKGDTGPSGVQALDTETGSGNLAHIGGSWSAGHTVVKSIDLKAGTYQVDLTGDFYKVLSTTATPVLQIQLNGADHQLTGYTGAFPYNAAEGFGVGTDGSPNGLEQTAVATGIITLSADTTVEVDAFGYNPDRSGSGGGDFDVNATVSFIQLTPAA